MGFMDSYKRLEKLCGEVLNDDRRVSAYIDEMLNTPRGASVVRGWEEDLKQLKHYRWVRNKISHDTECTEKNMCNASDVQWIDNFYARIMKQTDPLALYRKALQRRKTTSKKKTSTRRYQQTARNDYDEFDGKATLLGFVLTILLLFAMVAVLVWMMKL